MDFRALKKTRRAYQRTSLKQSWHNLSSTEVRSKSSNNAKHSSTAIDKLSNTKLTLEFLVFMHGSKG